jgi:hypothetical protein
VLSLDKQTDKYQEAYGNWIDFCEEIKHKNRFYSKHQFLNEFQGALEKHQAVLKEGTLLYRARLGGKKHEIYNDSIKKPFPKSQMGMPPEEKAFDGRGNPKGIPYLYMTTNIETAIAEVRPWRFAKVSIATIQLRKGLRVADVTYTNAMKIADIDHYMLFLFAKELSKPVALDKSLDYVPTQFITEMIKTLGFDGIKFTSSFGYGENVILFSNQFLEFTKSELYKVNQITYDFDKAR